METKPNSQLDGRLKALVVEALHVQPQDVHPELALGDLPEWDSMGHMEIMLLLEEQFGVEIDAETIGALDSLPKIRAHILRKEQAHG